VAKNEPAGPVEFPSDLTALTAEELAALDTQASAEFDSIYDSDTPDLERASVLRDGIAGVREVQASREAAAVEQRQQLDEMRAQVHPAPAEPAPADAALDQTAATPADPAPVAVTAAVATTQARGGDVATRVAAGQTLPTAPRQLNPTLGQIQAAQTRDGAGLARPNAGVLIASADIPGVALGAELDGYDALVAAISSRARSIPVTSRGFDAPMYPVATLPQRFTYNMSIDDRPEKIDEILQAAANPDALVAAGGWCAPSQISYDFFNIVCEDGVLDLPTVGIQRGGLRWPTSASYGDITGNYWSWTETQDVAAATGTAQSGTKTCIRVPCPAYNEARLGCNGLCITVGNLTEDAFPESIANYTRLTMAGFTHYLNNLRILNLVGQSVSITGFGAVGSGLVAPVLGSVELSAIDYREKYGMCYDAVLEVVLPRWLRGAMRADLRKRTNGEMDFLAVTDAQLMNMFDLMNVRVQWVGDWQVRTTGLPGASTPITLWPTSVQFMIYAPGTFVLGRGLQLNLGVVRDSVLNATNDHTAEWMEESWLIAKPGHESRVCTVAICPDGTTGAADLTACGV